MATEQLHLSRQRPGPGRAHPMVGTAAATTPITADGPYVVPRLEGYSLKDAETSESTSAFSYILVHLTLHSIERKSAC